MSQRELNPLEWFVMFSLLLSHQLPSQELSSRKIYNPVRGKLEMRENEICLELLLAVRHLWCDHH